MIIRRKHTFAVSRWSGGTTTELFIYPQGASYAARDFAVRVSTATVETPVSEFTHLPGFQRTLLVLDGELTMTHIADGKQWSVALKPLEQSGFSGDWETTGSGQVTDFNVMCSEGYRSTVKVLQISLLDSVSVEPVAFRTVLFVRSGAMKAGEEQVSDGDVMVMETGEGAVWTASEATVLIVVSIQLPE